MKRFFKRVPFYVFQICMSTLPILLLALHVFVKQIIINYGDLFREIKKDLKRRDK